MSGVFAGLIFAAVQAIAPLPGETWYGGMINDGTRQPYGATIGAVDLATMNEGGATASLLLSTAGRYVWSDRPIRYAFTNGVLFVESVPRCVPHRGEAGTLRDAYLAALRAHFPFKGKLPPRILFEKPQFNNWIEMCVTGFTQTEIERYAAGIVSNGYPCGVFAIDAGTQTYHGSVAFNPKTMPDPKGLFARLHANGWKTMLWTSYAVRRGTEDAQRLAPYLVKIGSGTVCRVRDAPGYDPATYLGASRTEGKRHCLPGARRTRIRPHSYLGASRTEGGDPATYLGASRTEGIWNSDRLGREPGAAFWDLTSPAACDALRSRLADFAAEYGIDGFKFDMGDPWRFTDVGGYVFSRPDATPADFSRGYLSLGAAFPLHEYRSGFNVCGQCRVQRLHDISHTWEHLRKMSYDVQIAGLLGSPFVFADMVGGGQEGDWKKPDFKPDEKLFVRMAAVQALQPMMQFSAAPWRVLSPEGNALCRRFAELHVAFAPQILALAEHAAKTGEPIVRTMEYVFPHQGFAKPMTQFMLGDDLLVAPVCEPDDSVRVELPAGTWTDDLGARHAGPKKLTLEKVPLDRLPRYKLEIR